jgi:hypothetical protein
MKKRELERLLTELGWWFLRSGANHDIWTNGTMIEPIGRHRELPERTAQSTLRKARAHPGTKK